MFQIKRFVFVFIFFLAFGLATTIPIRADQIRSPTGVATDAGEAAPGDLQHAIDGSGLSSSFVSGVTDFDTYVATNPSHTLVYSGFEWFSTEGVNSGNLFFDMGAVYQISRVALWNEESSGLTNIDVFFCSDAACTTSTAVGSYAPFNNPLDSDYPVSVFSLTAGATRYIRFSVTGPQPGNSYNGLSLGDVAFATSPAGSTIPEPTTMLLLGTGLTGIAGAVRRRSAKRDDA